KIQAKSSARHSYKEDQLNEKIATIRRDIAHYMQRCSFAEQGSDEEFDFESLRIEKERLEKLEQRLLKRKEQIQKRKENLKPQHRENHRINLIEPDARFTAKHNGLNYNAQAGVEDAIHLIAAADVVNEPNDQGQFIPIQQKVEKNISKDIHRRYTGDAGYHNLDDLEELENNNIDAIIADPTPNHRSTKSKPTSNTIILKEERKIERNDFIYHPEEDCYECPASDKLKPVRKKGKSTVYRASECENCQLSKYCIPSKKKIKQIHRSHREDIAERMSKRLQTDQAKQRMKMRSTSVEPVFGNLKHNLKFRRFSLRGLNNVRGEFNLMCIGHNLNVLFKWMQPEHFAALMNTPHKIIKQHIAISKNILAVIITKITRYFVNPYKLELQ
ncbi:MAG: transposase, partial [Maribacter sp.]|nr:transposase [Maribacter sp.]